MVGAPFSQRECQTIILTRGSEIVPGSSQKMLEKSRKLNVDCVVRHARLALPMI